MLEAKNIVRLLMIIANVLCSNTNFIQQWQSFLVLILCTDDSCGAWQAGTAKRLYVISRAMHMHLFVLQLT